jgi:hypothetical protein
MLKIQKITATELPEITVTVTIIEKVRLRRISSAASSAWRCWFSASLSNQLRGLQAVMKAA